MSALTLVWRQVRLISEQWAGPVSGVTPLAALIGPPGAPGTIGPAGATGPAGSAGPQGVAGPTGAIGSTGATGLTGAIGPVGIAGPQGTVGLTGAAGPAGATGPTGAIGATGATGASGAQGPAGAAAIFTLVEVDLGTPARRSGRFSIAVSGQIVGKPVSIAQAPGPYTGKGFAGADEAEMDVVDVSASVTSATQITAFWRSRTRVRGNVKFLYQIGG